MILRKYITANKMIVSKQFEYFCMHHDNIGDTSGRINNLQQ